MILITHDNITHKMCDVSLRTDMYPYTAAAAALCINIVVLSLMRMQYPLTYYTFTDRRLLKAALCEQRTLIYPHAMSLGSSNTSVIVPHLLHGYMQQHSSYVF